MSSTIAYLKITFCGCRETEIVLLDDGEVVSAWCPDVNYTVQVSSIGHAEGIDAGGWVYEWLRCDR